MVVASTFISNKKHLMFAFASTMVFCYRIMWKALVEVKMKLL